MARAMAMARRAGSAARVGWCFTLLLCAVFLLLICYGLLNQAAVLSAIGLIPASPRLGADRGWSASALSAAKGVPDGHRTKDERPAAASSSSEKSSDGEGGSSDKKLSREAKLLRAVSLAVDYAMEQSSGFCFVIVLDVITCIIVACLSGVTFYGYITWALRPTTNLENPPRPHST